MRARPAEDGTGISIDLRDIEQFLYDEAELLDSWKIQEWFQLFTEDCRYWVPLNTDDQDPLSAASLIYDDWTELHDRMARLLNPLVYTQQPRARTRRVIGNVRLGRSTGEEVQVFSNFLLYEVRLNRERILGGQMEHVLQRSGEGWRIKMKRVALLNNDTAMIPISLLL